MEYVAEYVVEYAVEYVVEYAVVYVVEYVVEYVVGVGGGSGYPPPTPHSPGVPWLPPGLKNAILSPTFRQPFANLSPSFAERGDGAACMICLKIDTTHAEVLSRCRRNLSRTSCAPVCEGQSCFAAQAQPFAGRPSQRPTTPTFFRRVRAVFRHLSRQTLRGCTAGSRRESSFAVPAQPFATFRDMFLKHLF